MFGLQVGQAVGALATETVSGTEVGLPLVADRSVALLPANVEAFAEGLGVDLDQVRLYLAVREAARVRLFSEVPWIGPQLVAAVRDYARDITIDTDRDREQRLQSVDPQRRRPPSSRPCGTSCSARRRPPPSAPPWSGSRPRSPSSRAGSTSSPSAPRPGTCRTSAALGEALRRRRATGGPAEKTFAGLVGLELRPRRLHDAANLWAALEQAGGAEGRDARLGPPRRRADRSRPRRPAGLRRALRQSESADVDAALDAAASGATARRHSGRPTRADGDGTVDRRARGLPALRADAKRVLQAWHAPDAQQEALRLSSSRTAPTTRTRVEAGAARAPHRELRWCSTPRSTRSCSRCTRRPGCGCSSAATSSRATGRCSRPRPARRARSPGSPALELHPGAGPPRPARAAGGGLRSVPRAPRPAVCGDRRRRGRVCRQRRVARRRLVAGGRAAGGQRRGDRPAGRRGADAVLGGSERVAQSTRVRSPQRGLTQLARCGPPSDRSSPAVAATPSR